MSTIAIISIAIIGFAFGFAVGVYATCKTIASGKVKNVKVVK